MDLFFDFFSENETIDCFCDELRELLSHVAPENREKICVAVSGGSDSMALLILSRIFAQKFGTSKIFCVTVNHNLRAEALNEALFVKNICNSIGVQHKILTWEHQYENFDHENVGKLENLAREARYNLISNFCLANKIKLMLTGHTWNDQLETSEMRGMMGSGAVGLAGMSRLRSVSENLKLARPLLHFSREHLRNFLRNREVTWKDDPMNEMDEFKRVSVRHKIKTYERAQLENVSQIVLKFGERRHKIEAEAVNLLKKCDFSDLGFAELSLDLFKSATDEIQCEVLKRLIWNVGGKKYAPTVTPENLLQIFKKNTIGRCLLKLKRNHLFIFREVRNLNPVFCYSVVNGEILQFDDRFVIKCHRDLTNISIEPPQNFAELRDFFKKNFPEIPSNAIKTLPCVYQNNKMMAALASVGMIEIEDESYRVSELFSCKFIRKPELFDIFL